MSNADKPQSCEIPGDWTTCVIVADIELLHDFSHTAGKASLYNLNVGKAVIERNEVESEDQFQQDVLDWQAKHKYVVVEWQTQKKEGQLEDLRGRLKGTVRKCGK